MRNLQQWLAGERAEILARRDADGRGVRLRSGWRLRGLGAYFAYAEHPWDLPSDQAAKRLVQDHGILMLPATMFTPQGDEGGERAMRIAFANLDRTGIATLFDRLQNLDL